MHPGQGHQPYQRPVQLLHQPPHYAYERDDASAQMAADPLTPPAPQDAMVQCSAPERMHGMVPGAGTSPYGIYGAVHQSHVVGCPLPPHHMLQQPACFQAGVQGPVVGGPTQMALFPPAPMVVAPSPHHQGQPPGYMYPVAHPLGCVAPGQYPPLQPTSYLPTRAAQWSAAEDEMITEAVTRFGCKWSVVCSFLPGRTIASVRNRWHRLQRARRAPEPLKDGCYRCGRCGRPKRGHVCRINARTRRDQAPTSTAGIAGGAPAAEQLGTSDAEAATGFHRAPAAVQLDDPAAAAVRNAGHVPEQGDASALPLEGLTSRLRGTNRVVADSSPAADGSQSDKGESWAG